MVTMRPLMRRAFAAFSRYRPRALTVVVLVVIAAMLVLTNLSFDQIMDWVGNFGARSYGWPLIWHRFVYIVSDGPTVTVGWYYSGGRLAVNLAIWLLVLAAAGGVCEWLMRRYQLRLRWSLRTMLAGVGLAALLCTWFAAVRKQANLQDPLIATSYGVAWVERWGPKWLDLVGADRFRRRIVGARLYASAADQEDSRLEGVLKQLALLPEIRYLFVEAEPPNYGIAEERLLIASRMLKLEYLRLRGMALHGKRLACLSRLTRLRRLDLSGLSDADKDESDEPLLANLPELPLMEGLDLQYSQIQDQDLRQLAKLPRLKALSLAYSNVTGDGLAELTRMPALEELEIDAKMLSEAGLKMLAECKSLKKLHIVPDYAIHGRSEHPGRLMLDGEDWVFVLESDLAPLSRGLNNLRIDKPGITIDKDPYAVRGDWWDVERSGGDYDAVAEHARTWFPSSGEPWLTPPQRSRLEAEFWGRFKIWATRKGLPTSF